MREANAVTRRTVLRAAGAAPVVALGSGLAGCAGEAPNDRALVFGSLDEALAELARLTSPNALPPATAWSWAKTLDHCAQSIEFSMQGFPAMRSALFRRTVGAAAFGVFAGRGRMSHDLGEPIPGAPPLTADADVAPALARLLASVEAFRTWQGELQPHFAYGALDKAEYEQAHAMHLADHFSAFDQSA